ncbi:MAG: hypothetical protein M1828_001218 [Chrysothrix sp. TS-e1954]|nr:MAG: hypothetical protein M1828_001218 [Chrysothrix sp. TS-e1954]
MSDPSPTPMTAGNANDDARSGEQNHSYFQDEADAVVATTPAIDAHSSSGDLNGLSTTQSAPAGTSTPSTPGLYPQYGGATPSHRDSDELDVIPPLDRLTVFDFLENLALPQRLEKIQNSIAVQTERVKRQQQKITKSSKQAKEKMVDEWRRRVPVPTPDEQLRKYRRSMRDSVERLTTRWTDAKNVTTREKTSFIAGVLNIFISGYIVGAFPSWFHIWYTIQIAYFYPIRFITYHKKGYHYFLVDLCYFVNLLLLLSLWVFPSSKRLFISTFCLAFGNNAIAIAMWRNSLVFHSLDKVTSLFIHIMPCVTLHCMVHLVPIEDQQQSFPAVYAIKTSSPSSPQHYGLASMALWSTLPYALWQLSYHFLITVRNREKIAAGRPTSFTWLRKSYAPTWIGKLVLSLPEFLQEPTFMLIQYSYALLTMIPAPIWFWFRWPSAVFLMTVFTWSIYNGAVYYIDVFGKRFQKELEQLKKDVAKMSMSPELGPKTSPPSEGQHLSNGSKSMGDISLGFSAVDVAGEKESGKDDATSTGVEGQGNGGGAHQRVNPTSAA